MRGTTGKKDGRGRGTTGKKEGAGDGRERGRKVAIMPVVSFEAKQ